MSKDIFEIFPTGGQFVNYYSNLKLFIEGHTFSNDFMSNFLKLVALSFHRLFIHHLVVQVAAHNIFLCTSFFSVILPLKSFPGLFSSLVITVVIIQVISKTVQNVMFA